MLTIESAAKESAIAEKTPIAGASRELLSPGNLREPRLRWVAVRASALGSGHTGELKFSFFSSNFEKNTYRGARCPKNHRRSRSNKLAHA